MKGEEKKIMLTAVIGGTGMNRWPGLSIDETRSFETPYGAPSGPLHFGRLAETPVLFFARHGEGHHIPPHAINYRANLHALHQAGVRRIVAIAAVGGIAETLGPAAVALPQDLIDYSYGRAHTYSDGPDVPLRHVEFTEPYSPALRQCLREAAAAAGVALVDGGIMGITQGPRLESAAEVRRLRRDGCDMVGMTGMPEAALARELEIDYACLALSVNWAAGIGSGSIHAEIEQSIEQGMVKIRAILARALPVLHLSGGSAPTRAD